MIEQPHAGAAGLNSNPVADLKALQNFSGKVDQDMIDAAVLSRHAAALARARPVQHHGRIADAGKTGKAHARVAAIPPPRSLRIAAPGST